ncbi:uncharacterized protein LOC123716296 isoform X1 [Pieris brassicae]|uniref:uncharacterized protein LOC123716296 isoform X1 n=1 Tax=Pieris brassicae TaxID=7116 RepID=UPI001E65F8B0|nr:uncharacterized protein LOC123716296 isoform X1 [Pieris brassicae]
MVNGNYVLYGDSPASESEIVDDHVHRKTVERKEKRKSNRSANDLQRSLNLAQKLDNETDSDKFEKKIKEPRLLRYVPTTEVQEHFVAEKFETYDLKPMEEPMKRYTFAKKPKNHADGSINYAYSRSSSSCSSPNGNLPTISEHGEQYGTYRIRSIQTSSNEGIGEYQTKLDKYFTSPRDVKSFTDKGSHPDSLYRVPSDRGRNTRKIVHMLRLLRWPVALFGVCVALAIFVYFLMPDNLGQEFDKINATNWEENFSSAQSYTTTSSKSGPLNRNISKSVNAESNNTRKLPIPPVFPTHIEPEVQYGNDDDNIRKPKLFVNTNTPDESTFRPHITHHAEKPLAIYFKDAEAVSTTTTEKITTEIIKKAETSNTLPKLEEITTKSPVFAPQPTPLVPINVESPAEIPKTYEARLQTTYNSNSKITPEPQEYYRRPEYESKVKFTSGHSKLFGISMEDSENIKSTTQSSLYNTRVSPTLPTWKDRDYSTTKNPINSLSDVPQCRSTRLSLCRGILPYDLAGLPARIGKKEVTLLLPQIKYLVATNCSDRVRHFACSLLEPECSPPPFSSKLPCYSLCKAIADRCEGYIPTELSPIFNCNQYSSSNCVNARSPCFDRELTCGDGTCVPRDWICDGTRDCPGGEDEAPCSTCEENEFRCQSGLCIVKRWVCDGYSDCPDGDDEIDESCRSHTNGEVQEPGEELAGSAPAPSIRKPYRQPQSRHYNGETDSKELLMTSDTTNALKRNFTRRPSPSRLTPYSRPMLRSRKEPEPTTMENLTEKPAASYRKNFRKQTQRVPESKKDLSEDMDQFYVDVIKEDERTVETPPPVATKLDKSIDNLERVIDGAELLRKAALARKQDLSRELNATEEDFGYNSAHASPCPNEELRCVDGRCITLAQLCDGTIDCSDHADEDNCYT